LSNDFANQGGSNEQIEECSDEYMVTFQQFATDHVTDPDDDGPLVPQPVFSWLAAQSNPGPAPSGVPSWNFNKYLISRDGELVAHWPTAVYPGDNPNDANDSFETNPIVMAIQAELAKP
jgi:glutathione peroxidase